MDSKVVVIKDFAIPKSCDDCDLCYDYVCCSITNTRVIEWSDSSKKRLPNCPLCEIEIES